MKINELSKSDDRKPQSISSDPLHAVKQLAKLHYNLEDEDQALLLLLVRAMKHSKEDDELLKAEVADLKQQISQIKQSKASPAPDIKPAMPSEPFKHTLDFENPKELPKLSKTSQGEIK